MRFLIFFVAVFLFAINNETIKIIEEKIKTNPSNKDYIALSNFYLKKDINKSIYYLKQVSSPSKEEKKYINKIQKEIKRVLFLNATYKRLHSKDINFIIKSLYEKNDYKTIKKISFYVKPEKLDESSLFIISRIFMWDGEYKKSLYFLNFVKNKNLDYYEIKAYNYFYLGDYRKAKGYFEILYYSTSKIDYAKRLLEIYSYLGEWENYKKIVLLLKRQGINVKKEENKLKEIFQKQINKLIEIYTKDPTFENLMPIFWFYYSKDKQTALKYLKEFIEKKPSNKRALLFYARVLSWDGNYKEAKKILEKIKNNLDAKLLLSKIYAWNGEYEKAKIMFLEIIDKGDKKQKYEAMKFLALIYLWSGNKKEAKKIFIKLQSQNPKDEEVKESLMIINKNFYPLIKKYLKLYKQNPNNEEYILKLADFYQAVENIDNAIKFNSLYLKLHPENIERYKILGELYLQKKEFYQAFSNLEYWAEMKGDINSKLALAKYYYWYGFNNEALKVIDEILKKEPKNKEAIKLKAKILKINPRFVMSKTSATIDDYFNKRANKILTLADRSYFNYLYENAIKYYKEYLFLIPDDYKVRQRYAYALEFSGKYKDAAGEFFHLYWINGDINDKYHYAFNLLKSKKYKLAKKIYLQLLNEIPKKPPKKIIEFLKNWEKAWESMDINRYYSFYDKKIFNNFWKLRKEAIFKKSGFISIGIYDPILIYYKNNIYKVKFYQVYASHILKDRGYKVLTLKCNKECKIIKEEFKKAKYKPYNYKNSLEFFVKRDLALIKRNEKRDNLDVNYLLKKKSIQLVPSLKKDLINKKEVLDIIELKKAKKVVLYKELKEKTELQKTNQLNLNAYYYKDKYSNFKYITLIGEYENKGIYFNNFFLNEKFKKNGYEIGIIYKPLILWFDSQAKSIGFKYTTNLLNHTLEINRKNLVYSRYNNCSTKFMSNKISLSKYKELNIKKSLWYSLDYEKIRNNNVLTPQFDIDLIQKGDFVTGIDGWYQFNSKKECYYSPKKIDNTLITLKYIKKNFQLSGAIGYSFLEKTKLWEINFLYNKNNFYFKCIKNYSFKNGIYSYIECKASIKKQW